MASLTAYNSDLTSNGMLALVPVSQQSATKGENIRVAVRVRPLLPQEAHRDEVVYYPTYEEGPLQVGSSLLNFFFPCSQSKWPMDST